MSTPVVDSKNLNVPEGWTEKDWNRIVLNIGNKKCVPIVGKSLSLIKATDANGLEYKHIYQGFLDSIQGKEGYVSKGDQAIDESHDPCSDNFSPVAESLDAAYFRNMVETGNSLNFANDFAHFCKSADYYTKPLEDFLRGWKYEAIINLCPCGILEEALTNLGYDWIDVTGTPTEGPLSFKERGRESAISVINVFGSVAGDTTQNRFAIATHQQLRYLLRLVNEGTVDYLPENPSAYRFLGVGCQTPDWLGRILIHWLAGGGTVRQVNVSSIDTETHTDKRLEQYTSLAGQSFRFVKQNPIRFSAEFQKLIVAENIEGEKPQPSGSENTIKPESWRVFLSFIGSADREPAESFCVDLDSALSHGNSTAMPVFIDNKMEAGDSGMDHILENINGAKTFIVVVSMSAIENVAQGDASDAFIEWKRIKERVESLGNRKGSLFVVFVYDVDNSKEHDQFKNYLVRKFSDPDRVYNRLFTGRYAQPNVVYYPRDNRRQQARMAACIELATKIIEESD